MKISMRILVLTCAISLVTGQSCLAGCGGSPDQKILTSGTLCGPIATRAILAFFGTTVDLDEAGKLCGYDEKNGTSLEGLCGAFRAKGLYAKAVKASSEELLASGLPFVAHYYYDHLVAVQHIATGQFKITYNEKGDEGVFSKAEFPKQNFDALYTGFAVLVSNDGSKFPTFKTDGPDLRVYDHVWDYGTTKYGEVVQHVFKLRNAGSKDLAIWKIETSCDCLTASVSANTLQPGKEADLLVTFDGSKSATQQDEVKVHSNDPVTPITTVLAQGFVKPSKLLPSPAYVDFQRPVRHGETARSELFVPQYPDKSIEITDISSDKFIDTAIENVDEKDRVGYNVVFTVRPDAPVGSLERKLMISTTHYAQQKAEVIVRADIVGETTAYPAQVFLGVSKKGTEHKATITVSTVSKDPLKIGKIDCPLSYVSVDVAPKTEGKEYVLTATLKPDAPLGNIKGEVTIHTNNPDQPVIKVPVYAYVEES